MFRIYGKSGCHFCQQAKELLNRRGLSYEEVNVAEETGRQLLISVVPEAKTVPQIFLEGRYIGGYNDLVSFLDEPNDNMLYE